MIAYLPLVGVLQRALYLILRCFSDEYRKNGAKQRPRSRLITCLVYLRPRAMHNYTVLHAMGGGMIVVLIAYTHLLLSIFTSNIYNLMQMTCGIWTVDLLKHYHIMERADSVTTRVMSRKFRTHQEEICTLTAKQRSLYWLTLPGLGCLAKMSGERCPSTRLIASHPPLEALFPGDRWIARGVPRRVPQRVSYVVPSGEG